MKRTFDREVRFDEESRGFGIDLTKGVRSRVWPVPDYLDQGDEGACVGFSFTHWLSHQGMSVSAFYARDVYKAAQQVDQWEGENYEGTSVLAGAKVLKSRHHISEYRWAFGIEELKVALSHYGPVVLGLNWYRGMTDTSYRGYIEPRGPFVGGHAILARGINVRKKRVLLHNSWGDDWGYRGCARISFDHLNELLHQRGECCIPIP